MQKRGYVVTGFKDSVKFGKKIARSLGIEFIEIFHKRFPDKESYIRFNKPLNGKKVIFVSFLADPDEKLIRLLFALKTAKQLGCKKNILVAPYLPYMRQDKLFNPGECVSNKALADLLNPVVDYLVTVDPHIHRIKSLGDIFTCKAVNIKSMGIISDYVKKKFPRCVVVGPDIESKQWVSEICAITGLPGVVLLKERFSSHKVRITMKKEDFQKIKGKEVVVFDDIVSSGGTMLKIVSMLKSRGVRKINIVCVHGIFAEGSFERLKKKGVTNIISSNTIKHKSNKIDIAPSIAERLKKDLR